MTASRDHTGRTAALRKPDPARSRSRECNRMVDPGSGERSGRVRKVKVSRRALNRARTLEEIKRLSLAAGKR